MAGYEESAAPKIILTAVTADSASLAGAGTVAVGGTTITGGNASGAWKAGGTGMVDISENSIKGDAASLTLTADHADSALTVAATALTVDAAAITLDTTSGTKGKVTLKGSTTAPGKLLLKGGTNAAVLDSDNSGAQTVTVGTTTADNFLLTPSDGSTATAAKVTKGDGTPIVAAGIAVKVAASDASSGSVFDSITAGATADTADVLITGPSTAVDSVIVSTWKVKVPNAQFGTCSPARFVAGIRRERGTVPP